MLGEEAFEQAGVANAAVATKNLNLWRLVGEELHLPPLSGHRHLHHDCTFTDRSQREVDAGLLKPTKKR